MASTCEKTGKVIHLSEGAAWGAIHSLERKGRGNPHYRVYRCGGHWHIGHDRQSINAAMANARRAASFASRAARKTRKR